jgi:transcriptional regulator with XRE-family HTH domain
MTLFKTAVGEVLLSKRSNVALGYISDIERGKKDLSSVVLQSLATGIGVSAAHLIIESGYRMGGWDITELTEDTRREYV